MFVYEIVLYKNNSDSSETFIFCSMFELSYEDLRMICNQYVKSYNYDRFSVTLKRDLSFRIN